MRVTEDGVWRYYNCPDPFWSAKCRACREKVALLRIPVEECVDCWKVEIWRPTGADFGPAVDCLHLGGIAVVAKESRAPIQVVRSGIPLSAYPRETTQHLLILYAGRIAERDLLLRAAQGALIRLSREEGAGSFRADPCVPELPIRRGCWRYDDVLGPWQTWYPVERDWDEAGARARLQAEVPTGARVRPLAEVPTGARAQPSTGARADTDANQRRETRL